MILDHLSHASIYRTLHPLWEQAFDYLRKFDPATPPGTHHLSGDALYAVVQNYLPVDSASRRFESHRKYADLQFVAAGEERLWYAPLDTLPAPTPYNEELDYSLYDEPSQATSVLLTPGMFTYLLPTDGHKPGCIWDRPQPVVKVVIKIHMI